jgi:hypothetical protein
VRLQLHALAYNLGNFLRTLATPEPIKNWSLTTLREKLIKIGAKMVRHGRYVAFQMAEVAIPRNLFADILRMIAELRCRPLRRPLKELMCDAFETDHGLIGLPKPIDWHTETTQACQRTTNSADFYRNGRSSGECRP